MSKYFVPISLLFAGLIISASIILAAPNGNDEVADLLQRTKSQQQLDADRLALAEQKEQMAADRLAISEQKQELAEDRLALAEQQHQLAANRSVDRLSFETWVTKSYPEPSDIDSSCCDRACCINHSRWRELFSGELSEMQQSMVSKDFQEAAEWVVRMAPRREFIRNRGLNNNNGWFTGGLSR